MIMLHSIDIVIFQILCYLLNIFFHRFTYIFKMGLIVIIGSILHQQSFIDFAYSSDKLLFDIWDPYQRKFYTATILTLDEVCMLMA